MTAPPSRPGSGTARCGVEEGAFISHAIDATCHHGPVRFSRARVDGVTTFPSAVQIAINIALAAWGYTEMAKSKTK